jgi:hypothetical protein
VIFQRKQKAITKNQKEFMVGIEVKKQSGHIYINVSTGSKVSSSAGALECMI